MSNADGVEAIESKRDTRRAKIKLFLVGKPRTRSLSDLAEGFDAGEHEADAKWASANDDTPLIFENIDWTDEWCIPETTLERGDHAELGDLLLRIVEQRYRKVVAVGGRLYGYRGGIFEGVEKSELEWIVKGFAGRVYVGAPGDKSSPLRVSTQTLGGSIKMACAEAADDSFFDDSVPGVAFVDGFAVVSAAGIDFRPHSPDHRARHRYEFNFTGGDSPTKWLQYLEDVFRDDADKGDKIAAVQEFMGAAITGTATTYERALVLLGPGANGKTRLAEIIQASVPPGSSTSLPPALWNDQYARPLLYGARLNVVPDLTDDALGPVVKGIISGEGVAARSPSGPAVAFRPKAAHVFGCNQLPKTKDTSNGFFRRWLLIPMTRSFATDPARDPQIHRKVIASDTPAIVRWALQGAVRLMRQTEYTLPSSHTLTVDRWRGKVDGVRLFVESRARRAEGTERGTAAAKLYAAFAEWASAQGLQPETSTTFGLRLSDMGVPGKNTNAGKVWGLVLL